MERETKMEMDLAPLDALLKLLEESPVMHSSKNHILLEHLAFLRAFLMDPPQRFVEDGTMKELESLASQVESFIAPFDHKKMKEDKAIEFRMQLLKLLMPVRDWKYEAKLIFKKRSKQSRFYYPRTGQLVFIDHLGNNLEELVKDATSSTRPLNHFILRVQRKLQFWSSRLTEISEPRNKPLYLKDLIQSITNLAYEVEYAIDSFVVGDFPIWHCMFWLLNILKELEQVETESTDDDVVGFESETETTLERLIEGPESLTIISIVGAAGQGKTTLAKKLYGSFPVVEYFEKRTWCRVSQVYESRKLLLELLSQIVQLPDPIHHTDDKELGAMLHKHLTGRRFLLFLDDMWSIDAWNCLKNFFPNDKNGSRIVFTTRLPKLAFHGRVQTLCPISDDESWELLRKKLFQKERCPPELFGVGRQISKNCKGLPLSIISIAQLLAKMEKTVERWEQVAETVQSSIIGDKQSQSKGIIELSYTNLPNYLKPCFLYFGAFLEDKEVPVSKLMRLWIAEGFIKHIDFNSLEDVAEDYLMDLIDSSLVTVAQNKSTAGVKSCRVDGLLREFCLTKAKEENFFQQINGYDEHFPSSNDNLDYGMDPYYSYSSTPIVYQLRRLCIYSKRNHFFTVKPSGPFVQSLLFFAASDMCPSYIYDMSFIFQNFKLLRTLDLEGINTGDSFKAIDVLVLLRYLAVQCDVDFIPSSIVNLWNLETFLFKGLSTKVVKVPDSIWDMAKLRHVHINDSASFNMEPHRLENSSILDNLQTFSTPSLAYGDDMEKILGRLLGIRKLKCIFLDSWDDATSRNQFPKLDFLYQLVSLKVFYKGLVKYPCRFNFPSNLKKLTLSYFRMPWIEISPIATLPNLEVLKLLGNAFEGETWLMNDGGFPKLKFLKLETLNIKEWEATSDNFPCLERLLLHKCEQLEEIPNSIGDTFTLQMIEVMWCSLSAAISARKIQKEQLEFGNEWLKIHIHPNVWDLESSS